LSAINQRDTTVCLQNGLSSRAGGSSESLVRPMETVLSLIMDMSTFITKYNINNSTNK